MEKKIFPKKANKSEINELPILQYDGKIHLIDRADQVEPALSILQKSQWLGFDTETRPVFRKGQHHDVSLLQLSTSDNAFLFRLNITGFTDGLRKLMRDKNIRKIGVAVRDDIKALNRLAPFEAGGFVELANVASKLGITTLGLRSLAAIWLNRRISKGAQLSNWQAEALTESQMTYAATDAWVCLEMFSFLIKEGFSESYLLDKEMGDGQLRAKTR